jgi:signal transduction histidine kinase
VPSLLQFSSFFNVFGSLLVLGLSVVTLRLSPEPYFRAWVASYAWAILATTATALETAIGPSLPVFMLLHAVLMPSLWLQVRMGYALRERAFPAGRIAAAYAAVFAAAMGLFAAGLPFGTASTPGALAILVTFVWNGWVLVRVGRTPAYRGMGWIGVPMILQGLWLLTYPLLADTAYFWVGFGVAAMLEVGVGVGMAMFVLFRTAAQLEDRNQSLEEAERALRQTQALTHEFLNAASHELRTPLTSVVGYAEFLAEGVSGTLNDRQAEYVAQIRKGAGRLSRLVDDMLDFAVLEAGTFALRLQAVDVRAIARAEAESLLPQARERRIRLELALPDEPLLVRADPLRVGQIITNLAGNAVKFSRPGSAVWVRARREGAEIRVEVADAGIGIAAEHLPRLFRKFYRVDPSSTRDHGGAGLGLAISRALVEAQGGRIGAESVAGEGSTFWFTLPALDPNSST